jgi:hypothetical protein
MYRSATTIFALLFLLYLQCSGAVSHATEPRETTSRVWPTTFRITRAVLVKESSREEALREKGALLGIGVDKLFHVSKSDESGKGSRLFEVATKPLNFTDKRLDLFCLLENDAFARISLFSVESEYKCIIVYLSMDQNAFALHDDQDPNKLISMAYWQIDLAPFPHDHFIDIVQHARADKALGRTLDDETEVFKSPFTLRLPLLESSREGESGRE